MSFTVVGYPGATLVSITPQYDAEQKLTFFRYEYQGTETAIYGLQAGLVMRGMSYRTSNNGPVWTLTTEETITDSQDNPDRWEIYTESTEKSLFEVPDIIAEAAAFDASAAASDGDSYRKTVETVVEAPGSTFLGAAAVTNNLIAHLRSNVTGWQVDLLVLRRVRRVDRYAANNGLRIGLDTGLLLYTTAQLNLPSDVAFVLPDTPADFVYGSYTIAKWRWRKRSQRVEYVGNFADQTVELVFAPWSTLAYDEAGSGLVWA